MWDIWKYLLLLFNEIILVFLNILVDSELIYNLSSLDNYNIIYLFKSDWSNMELIQVLHHHVILFLLLIGFIYFGIYFLSVVYPIQIFPSVVLAPEKPPSELGNIMSLCSSLTENWSRCFCFFTRVTLILTNTESLTLVECITWGWFQSRHVIHW